MFHTVLGPVAFFRDISQKLEFNSKGFFSVFLYVFGIRFLSPKNYVTIILQKERGFLNDRNDRFMNLDELVNKYHTDLNCSGIKRTIEMIRLSDVEGKGACSKCWKE